MIETTSEPRRDSRPYWRAIAIVLVTGAGGGAALFALRDSQPISPRFVVTPGDTTFSSAPPDPLATELLRCRAIPAGMDDAACRAAWEASRRHFLGESASERAPLVPYAAGR